MGAISLEQILILAAVLAALLGLLRRWQRKRAEARAQAREWERSRASREAHARSADPHRRERIIGARAPRLESMALDPQPVEPPPRRAARLRRARIDTRAARRGIVLMTILDRCRGLDPAPRADPRGPERTN